jgi:dTDP-glucose 4,6-dehydratase
MSRWLVIGASSFTGSHFCRYLRGRGEKVYETSLRTLLMPGSFDYVVSFAALNVVAPSWDHPADYFRVNVQQQIRFWEELAKIQVRYLHVSTPEVYGSTAGWVSEEHPYRPSTPYAASRAAAEMILKCFHLRYDFPVIMTRACNVYGPGQQLHRLIPKLIVSIKKGVKFKLDGGGASMRSYLHAADVCEATYLIATKGTPGEAYHISTTATQSIYNIAQMVCTKLKVRPVDAIEVVPDRPGKDQAYYLRAEKLTRLGWEPRIALPAGIDSVIEWVEREWEALRDQPMEYEFRP